MVVLFLHHKSKYVFCQIWFIGRGFFKGDNNPEHMYCFLSVDSFESSTTQMLYYSTAFIRTY